MLAAIGTLIESDATRVVRATDDRPRLSLAAPHPCVHDVGIRGIQFEISGSDAVRHEQRLLPGLSTISSLEYSALSVGLERVPDRRDPHDVRVRRVNVHGADL